MKWFFVIFSCFLFVFPYKNIFQYDVKIEIIFKDFLAFLKIISILSFVFERIYHIKMYTHETEEKPFRFVLFAAMKAQFV